MGEEIKINKSQPALSPQFMNGVRGKNMPSTLFLSCWNSVPPHRHTYLNGVLQTTFEALQIIMGSTMAKFQWSCGACKSSLDFPPHSISQEIFIQQTMEAITVGSLGAVRTSCKGNAFAKITNVSVCSKLQPIRTFLAK